MRNATILSTGAAAPEQVISNQFFNELLGEDVDTWLRERVNIHERRWLTAEQSVSDLCVAAAGQAMERAGITASDLDLIIIATDTPEFISPSTASVVQHRLGASHAGTFDLNTACAGFVTALDTASAFIRSHARYDYILVVGAYGMSKYLNLSDKKTVTLFADGAGAVILGATDQSGTGYLASHLHTLGHYHDGMGIYAGGTKIPVTPEVLAAKDHLLKFVYKFPPELNPQQWSEIAIHLCEETGMTPGDVSQYFFTQININSIRETLDRLHQPHEKAHTIMDRYGYTGSACIPMAFDEAIQQGKVAKGDVVMFIGSGGGLAFAGAAFRM